MTRFPRIALILLAAPLLGIGCGDRESSRQRLLDEKEAALRDADRAMTVMEREHEADLAAQAARLRRTFDAELDRATSETSAKLEQALLSIEALESELSTREREMQKLSDELEAVSGVG